jgi:serine/threonine protein kinase
VAVLAAGTILDGRYEIVAPLADHGARERFLRESRTAAQLRHPNIVSILDFNLDAEGRPFLVMELLSGPSLRQGLSGRESRFAAAIAAR